MTQILKGIILGIDNILAAGKEDNAQINQNILDEMVRLINLLRRSSIQLAVLANRDWFINGQRLEDFLKSQWGYSKWFIANNDDVPHKPSKDCINHVLNVMGWNKNETVYLGNTDADMKTAVNSGILFLNATWYAQTNDYGFEFNSPKDVAKFIDIFCLRSYLWQYSIRNQDLEYYALGIFGTKDPEYKAYTEDAKEAAKKGRGHLDFWLKYLVSSIYFSGLHERIDYIAPYPGHGKHSSLTMMEEALIIFAKCFRKTYLKDLVFRHKTAIKSAFARYNQEHLDHFNQLNTIYLKEFPLKKENGERYKKSPLKLDKTVLIIDDFCTQGYSLEAARVYVEQTGARAICLSLLKTINRDYEQIIKISKFSPFKANTFSLSDLKYTKYPYRDYIVNPSAHEEIGTKLQAYDSWQWPEGI